MKDPPIDVEQIFNRLLPQSNPLWKKLLQDDPLA
jgi:hypothetical protein